MSGRFLLKDNIFGYSGEIHISTDTNMSTATCLIIIKCPFYFYNLTIKETGSYYNNTISTDKMLIRFHKTRGGISGSIDVTGYGDGDFIIEKRSNIERFPDIGIINPFKYCF